MGLKCLIKGHDMKSIDWRESSFVTASWSMRLTPLFYQTCKCTRCGKTKTKEYISGLGKVFETAKEANDNG